MQVMDGLAIGNQMGETPIDDPSQERQPASMRTFEFLCCNPLRLLCIFYLQYSHYPRSICLSLSFPHLLAKTTQARLPYPVFVLHGGGGVDGVCTYGWYQSREFVREPIHLGGNCSASRITSARPWSSALPVSSMRRSFHSRILSSRLLPTVLRVP